MKPQYSNISNILRVSFSLMYKKITFYKTSQKRQQYLRRVFFCPQMGKETLFMKKHKRGADVFLFSNVEGNHIFILKS